MKKPFWSLLFAAVSLAAGALAQTADGDLRTRQEALFAQMAAEPANLGYGPSPWAFPFI